MTAKLLTAVLIIAIFGLMTWQRFDAPPQTEVFVVSIEGKSEYAVADTFRRGEVIKTADEYLALAFGNGVEVYLSKNSEIVLDRIFENERIITLTRGRIVASALDDAMLWIDTRASENLVQSSIVTFVNFNFLEELHIIPLEGSAQTTIKDSNEYLLLPVPIVLDELKGTYKTLEVNLEAGDAAAFYEWVLQ